MNELIEKLELLEAGYARDDNGVVRFFDLPETSADEACEIIAQFPSVSCLDADSSDLNGSRNVPRRADDVAC